jgi:glucose/arabinose dehydrogenase
VPAVQYGGQNGLLGVYTSPTYEKDRGIYLTYSEPGEDPATSSLALAHATLDIGQGSASLSRIIVDGATARPAERWTMGFRVRDVEQAPDGSLWLLEDTATGGLYKLAPR